MKEFIKGKIRFEVKFITFHVLIIYSIENNNTTREHLTAKEAVIEKCLNNSTAHRIEHQTRIVNSTSKKYEDFYSNMMKSKEVSKEEDAKVRAEIKSIENEMLVTEDQISDFDKEFSELEQKENEIDLELEKYQAEIDLHKANEKEFKQVRTDLESDLKKLQIKNDFAAEQENSIAEINGSMKSLIDECEKLGNEKTKLHDHVEQLDIELKTFTSLVSK